MAGGGGDTPVQGVRCEAGPEGKDRVEDTQGQEASKTNININLEIQEAQQSPSRVQQTCTLFQTIRDRDTEDSRTSSASAQGEDSEAARRNHSL